MYRQRLCSISQWWSQHYRKRATSPGQFIALQAIMCSKRQFRDKKRCLCSSIIDIHFLFSYKYFKIYFLIDHHYGTQSESSESVAVIRFLWCSCRVLMICDMFIRTYHRNEPKYDFMVEINTFLWNYNYYRHATMHSGATDTPFWGH